jgi:hypothetical protein
MHIRVIYIYIHIYIYIYIYNIIYTCVCVCVCVGIQNLGRNRGKRKVRGIQIFRDTSSPQAREPETQRRCRLSSVMPDFGIGLFGHGSEDNLQHRLRQYYGSIRQHTRADVSIREQTSAYVSDERKRGRLALPFASVLEVLYQ